MTSTCRHCRTGIIFNDTVKDEWTHYYGGTYCRDENGFTAMPLHVAEPVLEMGVL